MSPLSFGRQLVTRSFDPSLPANAYRQQWKHPSDVFSILLLLGGDVVNRALAQLAGTGFTPVAFSFGWVAYAVSALVSSVGENKLMPEPDCTGLIVNGEVGNVRENTSWVIGRLIRDFGHWCPSDTKEKVRKLIDEKYQDARAKNPDAKRDKQAGLCITVFQASDRHPAGVPPVFSWLSTSGIIVTIVQLGIAAIPCGVYGDWGILMITVSGVALSYLFGWLPQWRAEKWACRRNTGKTVVLTRGNGAQHAIVILGKGLGLAEQGRGLDLEDLSTVAANVEVVASFSTRLVVSIFAILWVFLLITAAGTKANTWFLVGVGGIGIIQNAAVAGWHRQPKHFGVPLKYVEVLGNKKVMQALFELEERYPHAGRHVRDIFFQGTMFPTEKEQWRVLDLEADWYDAARKAEKSQNEAEKADKALADAQDIPKGALLSGTHGDDTASRITKLSDAAREARAKEVKSTKAAKKAEATALEEREKLVMEHDAGRKMVWAWKAPILRERDIYT